MGKEGKKNKREPRFYPGTYWQYKDNKWQQVKLPVPVDPEMLDLASRVGELEDKLYNVDRILGVLQRMLGEVRFLGGSPPDDLSL